MKHPSYFVTALIVYLAFIGVMARRLSTRAPPPPRAALKPKPTLLDWLRHRQTPALA